MRMGLSLDVPLGDASLEERRQYLIDWVRDLSPCRQERILKQEAWVIGFLAAPAVMVDGTTTARCAVGAAYGVEIYSAVAPSVMAEMNSEPTTRAAQAFDYLGQRFGGRAVGDLMKAAIRSVK